MKKPSEILNKIREIIGDVTNSCAVLRDESVTSHEYAVILMEIEAYLMKEREAEINYELNALTKQDSAILKQMNGYVINKRWPSREVEP